MSFLKAEWRKLVLVNYEVDPKILTKYIPYQTELDFWKGKCYVSLVGFMFKNTKLLGVKIPFHINFEEVNLRFYVKYQSQEGWRRGVVFIKEIVPKPALTFVANTIYQEHYETRPMKHIWEILPASQKVSYSWKIKDEWQSIQVEAELMPRTIKKNSETEFITEHYWGYTKINDRKTFEYEVTHPAWKDYKILNHDIQIDFSKTYGKDFELLNHLSPLSVMLAEGSEITVEGKREIYQI